MSGFMAMQVCLDCEEKEAGGVEVRVLVEVDGAWHGLL
jgi:hypothetical protein